MSAVRSQRRYDHRLVGLRAVLWALVGVATAVVVARYARGLGATTALSDANPWGLWIGFDVITGALYEKDTAQIYDDILSGN